MGLRNHDSDNKMDGIHDGGLSGDRISATILYIYLNLYYITVSDILGHITSTV